MDKSLVNKWENKKLILPEYLLMRENYDRLKTASKKILEINCRKIEHIRLVNTFMKLLEYEKTINETKM